VILDGERPVGWINWRLNDPGTPQQSLHLHFDALPDKRSETPPPGVAQVIARDTITVLDKHGCDEVFFLSPSTRTTAVARSCGGEQLGRMDEYVLWRKDADTESMQQWLATLPPRNADLRLEYCEFVPDHYLERYANLFNQFILDMPLEGNAGMPFRMDADDMRRQYERCRQHDARYPTILLLDGADEIAAYTTVCVNLQNPADIFQAMTGVVRAHRGRGLSKWLKAAMFFKIGEDYPANESIRTIMRAVNEPIQSLNARMGFVLRRQGAELRITRQALSACLES
jgi:hypothetical protein